MDDSRRLNLIRATPDAGGNSRTYLELPDGRKLPLPFHYRPSEFALPGNMETYADGRVFALYDDTTRTGAIYDGVGLIPYWTLIQPTTRAEFYEHQVPRMIDFLLSLAETKH